MSTTPPATATAIAMMVERGSVSADSPAGAARPLLIFNQLSSSAVFIHACVLWLPEPLASWLVDAHQSTSSPRNSLLLWLVAKNPIFKHHLKAIACMLMGFHMECSEPGPGRRTYTDALNSAIGAVHSKGVGYGLRGAQDFQYIQLQALLVQIRLQAQA